MNLTSEQISALSTDKHLSVTANAGSGKTFVLVERFKKILKQYATLPIDSFKGNEFRIDPTRILAITFTRKAASEMLAKVVRSFDEDLTNLIKSDESQKKDFKQINLLRKIREGLTYARISTIHSFCSSLLKEYPIEAGVPLNFAELSEPDKIRLTNKTIESTLEDWLTSSDYELRNNSKRMLRMLNQDKVNTIVSAIIDKIEIKKNLDIFYAKSDQEILDEIKMIMQREYVEPLLNFAELLIQIVNRGVVGSLNKKFPDALVYAKKISYHLNTDRVEYSTIIAILDAFQSLKKFMLTDNGIRVEFKKCLDNTADIDYLDNLDGKNLQKQIDVVKNYVDNFDKQVEQIGLSRLLLDFSKVVMNSIDEEKLLLNALDMNDLQMYASKLLDNPDVVARIRSKVDFLMVDEFQDTNQLQYDIIKKLMPELEGKDGGKDSINLFIVGDVKQSIYGFRNADVRVFQQAGKDISDLNSKSSSDETAVTNMESSIGNVNLTTTFRLSPVPASFVNKVCSKLMNSQNSDYDVDYIPLICSKDVESLEENNLNIIKDSRLGSISFLLSELPQKPNQKNSEEVSDEAEEDTGFLEENLIAKYILKLVNDPINDYEFKDITILSQTKNNFQKLATKFIEFNIPFLVHSGKGFYQSPEIIDILSFMKFIYNPDDDAALISVLRSRYFNMDDSSIYRIAKSEAEGSFWEKLNHLISESDYNLIVDSLTNIIATSASMPVSKIIIMINQTCGWYGTINDSNAKYQILANMDKFIQIAREYENKGFKNLYDFVEEMNFISGNKILESEAAIITGENAVNIMTIHASKGLEFPVVILFNSNFSSNHNPSYYITPEYGIGYKIPVAIEELYKQDLDTPQFLINKRISQLAEKAEKKRLLYVALTRSKSKIVISSTYKYNEKKDVYTINGFIADIISSLEIKFSEIIAKDTILISDELNVYNQSRIYPVKITYPIDILTNIDISGITSEVRIIKASDIIMLNKDIKSTQTNEMFSPTKLMTYESDSLSYSKKYIFGMPDINPIDYDKDFEIQNDMPITTGFTAGLAIHSVLQSISGWISADGIIKTESLKDAISKCTKADFETPSSLSSRLMVECLKIAGTKLIKNNLKHIFNGKPEFNLILPINGDILNGSIDLLIENEDSIEIWDWKSNVVNEKFTIEVHAKHYELQMRTYAYFVHKLYPEKQNIKARLLFTRLAIEDADNKAWSYEFSWNREELINIESELSQLIMGMRNHLYSWL